MGENKDNTNAAFFQFWAGEDIERWKLLQGYTVIHEKYGRGEVKRTFQIAGLLRIGVQFKGENNDKIQLKKFITSKFKLYFYLPELPRKCAEDTVARTSFEDHLKSQVAIENGLAQKAGVSNGQIKKLKKHKPSDCESGEVETMKKIEKDRLQIRHSIRIRKLADLLKKWLSTSLQRGRYNPKSSVSTDNHGRLTGEQITIRKYVKRRGIKEVLHFTRIENLRAILEHGIIPRKFLDDLGINYIPADNNRYDGLLHASCFSISFPNYKMFYKLRRIQGGSWVVLSFSPEVLWQYECAFYPRNAAAGNMRDLPLSSRKNSQALAELFGDIPRGISRAQLNIPDSYPTDPQAEVVVFDVVPVSMLQRIYVSNPSTKQQIKMIISRISVSIPCSIEPRFFEPRQDYKFWSNHDD